MRKTLKQLHGILTLVAGVFIIIQSITGGLLVFGKEIQYTLFPHHWTIAPQEQSLDLEQLISQLNHEAYLNNTQVHRLNLSQDPEIAWTAKMANGQQWNINPYTGKILLRFEAGQDFYSTILYLHRWLLLKDPSQKAWARHLLSIAATVLIIQCIIGTLLWLNPRKKALKRLKPKHYKSARANITQWHLTLGVFSCVFITLIAYTGIGFNWPVVSKLVEWGSNSSIHSPPPPAATTVGGTDNWALALEQGLATMPTAKLHRIYLPQQPNKPIALRLKNPGEFHPFSYVWLDGGNGEILGQYDASQASNATRVWNFKYKFHIGNFAGLPIRVLWLLLSLLPAFFVISGLWLWQQRRKRKRQ